MSEISLSLLNSFLVYVITGGAAVFILMMALEKFGVKMGKIVKPPMTTKAVIISKRPEVKAKDSSKKAYTVYFATFKFVGGERKELEIPSKEYGRLALGDVGKLTFHENEYMNFAFEQE